MMIARPVTIALRIILIGCVLAVLPIMAQEPNPTATPGLSYPTPATQPNTAAASIPPADFAIDTGWSCGDFPCENDMTGFLQRIRVPAGFELSHYGQFPGQVRQIIISDDGRLYATVLENGVNLGAVYVMNDDGSTERYSNTLVSPLGLAFQPATDTLYVSARLTPDMQGGAIWRIRSNRNHELLREDLPCCFLQIGNQPNGMIFAQDGWLYVGVGALSDHSEGESANQLIQPQPEEAAILRIHPHTGETQVFANGIHNAYDLAQTSSGTLFATDTGILMGAGDRLLQVQPGGFYGWPLYRRRGCKDCPFDGSIDALPDLITFPDYSLPRGLSIYQGEQFPGNMFDTLFVTLWNDDVQRVVWIDPARLTEPDYIGQPFVTGLIRPIDVITAPDGSLLVADETYGHIWQVRYTGETSVPAIDAATQQPTPDVLSTIVNTNPTATATRTQAAPSAFVTNTPGG